MTIGSAAEVRLSPVDRLDQSGALRFAYYRSHAVNIFRFAADVVTQKASLFFEEGFQVGLDALSQSAEHHFHPTNAVLPRTLDYLQKKHGLPDADLSAISRKLLYGKIKDYQLKWYYPVILPAVRWLCGDRCNVLRRQVVREARGLVEAAPLHKAAEGCSRELTLQPARKTGKPVVIQQNLDQGKESSLQIFECVNMGRTLVFSTALKKKQQESMGNWALAIRASAQSQSAELRKDAATPRTFASLNL